MGGPPTSCALHGAGRLQVVCAAATPTLRAEIRQQILTIRAVTPRISISSSERSGSIWMQGVAAKFLPNLRAWSRYCAATAAVLRVRNQRREFPTTFRIRLAWTRFDEVTSTCA